MNRALEAFRCVSLIGQRPLLMIAGREAVTSWMSIQALRNATGPRELHWIDGASHVGFYYKEQYTGALHHQAHRILHQEPHELASLLNAAESNPL